MHHSIHNITVSEAWNDVIWDTAGKRYIDLSSGIFAANIGHRRGAKAIADQCERLVHSYMYRTEIQDTYLRELCEFTGFESAYLFSSGTEAVEAAWKVARRMTGKPRILGLPGAFHGKTLGSLIAAGKEQDWRNQAAPGAGKTGAFIMEPYRAVDAQFHDARLIEKVKEIVKQEQCYLIADEIQGGFGRTGTLFGYEHYGLKPDLVCIGKGMGNGFPMSGLLGPSKLIDHPAMELSSTNGGNPLACAAGLAVIRYMKRENIIARSCELGKKFHSWLADFPVPVQGRGMVAALIFDDIDTADKVVVEACKRGVLVVHTMANTVKLGPPLTIAEDRLKEAVEILGEVCQQLTQG